MTVFWLKFDLTFFFHHLVNLRFSLDFLGHFMTYHARFLKKKFFFYWSKIALSWVPTS